MEGTKYGLKEDGSVVTDVDRNVEILLRKEINKNFPSHGILGISITYMSYRATENRII